MTAWLIEISARAGKHKADYGKHADIAQDLDEQVGVCLSYDDFLDFQELVQGNRLTRGLGADNLDFARAQGS